MKKAAVAVFEFLIYSNLFIALAAVFFTVETVILLHLPLAWHPYLFIAFFATLFDYCLHRYVGMRRNSKQLENDIWIKEHSLIFYFFFAGSLAGLIISVFFAKPEIIFFLLPMAFIAMSYTLRIFRRNGIFYRLIDFPAAKIILLTSVWSLTTVLLPVIQADEKIFNANILMLAAGRWFYVFALAIPFDMRDRESDGLSGVRTLPVVLGNERSLYLSYFALGVFVLLEILRTTSQHAFSIYTAALLLSAIFTFITLRKAKPSNPSYYYYGLLDGMIFLQSVFVICIYLL